jgi:phosphatidylglycerol phospholipase C
MQRAAVTNISKAKYLPICSKYLPDFHITYIGWNIPYARQFLELPDASFNMFQKIMIGPGGTRFMKEVRKAGRSLFFWTINDDNTMRWCISKQVDGVITDDPRRYLELCRSYKGEKVRVTMKGWASFAFIKIMIPFYRILVQRRYGTNMSTGQVKQDILISRREHLSSD